jgi:hypothetical protein
VQTIAKGNENMTSANFERALKNEIQRFRSMFAEHNSPNINITITASGPVDHGDVAITFSIGESQWGDESVKGSSLDHCASEYFRRKGWKRAHDYLALPYFEPEEN